MYSQTIQTYLTIFDLSASEIKNFLHALACEAKPDAAHRRSLLVLLWCLYSARPLIIEWSDFNTNKELANSLFQKLTLKECIQSRTKQYFPNVSFQKMMKKNSRCDDEGCYCYDIHPKRQGAAFLQTFTFTRRREMRHIISMGGITALRASVRKEAFITGETAFRAADRSKTSSAGRAMFRIQADFGAAMFAKKTRPPLLHTDMRGLSRSLITGTP